MFSYRELKVMFDETYFLTIERDQDGRVFNSLIFMMKLPFQWFQSVYESSALNNLPWSLFTY